MDHLLLLLRLASGREPLHEIPQHLPPAVGHWVADRLGLGHAYAYFCHHCPEPTLWDPEPED